MIFCGTAYISCCRRVCPRESETAVLLSDNLILSMEWKCQTKRISVSLAALQPLVSFIYKKTDHFQRLSSAPTSNPTQPF